MASYRDIRVSLKRGDEGLARKYSLDAEAWASGTRDGVPIGPDDPAYQGSAKYRAQAIHEEVTSKADKRDTVLETTLSRGRKANSETGIGSVAFGSNTEASGMYSQAEGTNTTASGDYSHAEGNATTASGDTSHAEGNATQATGAYSHAEGDTAKASGNVSHAEGRGTKAVGNYSHAEGQNTTASGMASHSQGTGTTAYGDYSMASGYNTYANLKNMTVIGTFNKMGTSYMLWISGHAYVKGDRVTYERSGYECVIPNNDDVFTASKWRELPTNGDYLFAVGNGSGVNARSNAFAVTASGDIELGGGITGKGKLANGNTVQATGDYAVAMGDHTIANLQNMTAVGANNVKGTVFPAWVGDTEYDLGDRRLYNGKGYECVVHNTDTTFDTKHWKVLPSNGDILFAVGIGSDYNSRRNALAVTSWGETVLSGSISQGRKENTKVGVMSTALGSSTASGSYSHSEGLGSIASGMHTHAEGNSTHADGTCAHAEGWLTDATGGHSHAEGYYTSAEGENSHSEGYQTHATGAQSHAEGEMSWATASRSHAEGFGVRANGANSHAGGYYTYADKWGVTAIGSCNTHQEDAPDWEEGGTYQQGDVVRREFNDGLTVKYYQRIHEGGTDTVWNASWWKEVPWDSKYAFVVGNGTAIGARSNALTLQWDGTLRTAGDIYAQNDQKLFTRADVIALLQELGVISA